MNELPPNPRPGDHPGPTPTREGDAAGVDRVDDRGPTRCTSFTLFDLLRYAPGQKIALPREAGVGRGEHGERPRLPRGLADGRRPRRDHALARGVPDALLREPVQAVGDARTAPRSVPGARCRPAALAGRRATPAKPAAWGWPISSGCGPVERPSHSSWSSSTRTTAHRRGRPPAEEADSLVDVRDPYAGDALPEDLAGHDGQPGPRRFDGCPQRRRPPTAGADQGAGARRGGERTPTLGIRPATRWWRRPRRGSRDRTRWVSSSASWAWAGPKRRAGRLFHGVVGECGVLERRRRACVPPRDCGAGRPRAASCKVARFEARCGESCTRRSTSRGWTALGGGRPRPPRRGRPRVGAGPSGRAPGRAGGGLAAPRRRLCLTGQPNVSCCGPPSSVCACHVPRESFGKAGRVVLRTLRVVRRPVPPRVRASGHGGVVHGVRDSRDVLDVGHGVVVHDVCLGGHALGVRDGLVTLDVRDRVDVLGVRDRRNGHGVLDRRRGARRA